MSSENRETVDWDASHAPQRAPAAELGTKLPPPLWQLDGIASAPAEKITASYAVSGLQTRCSEMPARASMRDIARHCMGVALRIGITSGQPAAEHASPNENSQNGDPTEDPVIQSNIDSTQRHPSPNRAKSKQHEQRRATDVCLPSAILMNLTARSVMEDEAIKARSRHIFDFLRRREQMAAIHATEQAARIDSIAKAEGSRKEQTLLATAKHNVQQQAAIGKRTSLSLGGTGRGIAFQQPLAEGSTSHSVKAEDADVAEQQQVGAGSPRLPPPPPGLPWSAFKFYFGAALDAASHGTVPMEWTNRVVRYEWKNIVSLRAAEDRRDGINDTRITFAEFHAKLAQFVLLFCSNGSAFATPLKKHCAGLLDFTVLRLKAIHENGPALGLVSPNVLTAADLNKRIETARAKIQHAQILQKSKHQSADERRTVTVSHSASTGHVPSGYLPPARPLTREFHHPSHGASLSLHGTAPANPNVFGDYPMRLPLIVTRRKVDDFSAPSDLSNATTAFGISQSVAKGDAAAARKSLDVIERYAVAVPSHPSMHGTTHSAHNASGASFQLVQHGSVALTHGPISSAALQSPRSGGSNQQPSPTCGGSPTTRLVSGSYDDRVDQVVVPRAAGAANRGPCPPKHPKNGRQVGARLETMVRPSSVPFIGPW